MGGSTAIPIVSPVSHLDTMGPIMNKKLLAALLMRVGK
jgi:hypothetical protein